MSLTDKHRSRVFFFPAPDMAPPNVRVELLQDNSIMVTWDLLSEKLANGHIRGYIVYCRVFKNYYHWHDDGELGKSVNVSSSETQIVLSGLDGGRLYQVSVLAYTIDMGPRSEWIKVLVGKY